MISSRGVRFSPVYRRDLKRLVESKSDPDEIKKKRASLCSYLQRWRKQQSKLTPRVIPAVVQLDPNTKVEDEKLCIPSDFSLSDRQKLGL
jgi:hypothetical protein